jgi:hypothetical protein
MDCISMRRSVGMAALVLLVGATFASPAAGQSQRCQAPEKNGWHSCLTTSHRTIDDGPEVRLVEARPRLVMRADRCPERAERRSVVIRTGDGDRLGRETVRGTCKRGVTRWVVDLTLNVDLPGGTVVRSRWSGIADSGDGAPKVKLNH